MFEEQTNGVIAYAVSKPVKQNTDIQTCLLTVQAVLYFLLSHANAKATA